MNIQLSWCMILHGGSGVDPVHCYSLKNSKEVKRSQKMATYQVAPPEPFIFSRPEEWQKWVRHFERFRKASVLEDKTEVAQINTLIYSMGDQADDILRSFRRRPWKIYDIVKQKFDSHFMKRHLRER